MPAAGYPRHRTRLRPNLFLPDRAHHRADPGDIEEGAKSVRAKTPAALENNGFRQASHGRLVRQNSRKLVGIQHQQTTGTAQPRGYRKHVGVNGAPMFLLISLSNGQDSRTAVLTRSLNQDCSPKSNSSTARTVMKRLGRTDTRAKRPTRRVCSLAPRIASAADHSRIRRRVISAPKQIKRTRSRIGAQRCRVAQQPKAVARHRQERRAAGHHGGN